MQCLLPADMEMYVRVCRLVDTPPSLLHQPFHVCYWPMETKFSGHAPITLHVFNDLVLSGPNKVRVIQTCLRPAPYRPLHVCHLSINVKMCGYMPAPVACLCVSIIFSCSFVFLLLFCLSLGLNPYNIGRHPLDPIGSGVLGILLNNPADFGTFT